MFLFQFGIFPSVFTPNMLSACTKIWFQENSVFSKAVREKGGDIIWGGLLHEKHIVCV